MFAMTYCTQASSAGIIAKCTSGNTIEYSDSGCEGRSLLPHSDLTATPVLPADRSAALQRAAMEKAELIRLENARHREEQTHLKSQRQQRNASAIQRRRCDEILLRKKWLEEERRAAGTRANRTINKKSRRLAERYAVNCANYLFNAAYWNR